MTYHPGDRVLVTTTAGEVPAVVRRADTDAGSYQVLVAGLLTVTVLPSALRPLDDPGDRPHIVYEEPG